MYSPDTIVDHNLHSDETNVALGGKSHNIDVGQVHLF
jgi:hypothetical protein